MHAKQLKPPRSRETRKEIVGEVRYHRELISPRLKHPRDILVWLPPSYSRSTVKRYPVLYAQDGQNLMDPTTAFLGRDWHLDETVTRLIRKRRIREIIVVGIFNTPDRLKEYSGSGMGRAYAGFLAEELKPYIDSAYRTLPENAAVMGSSMGALSAFYTAWWYSDQFPQVACLSGSFFWKRDHAVRTVIRCRGARKNIRIYLDVGSGEKYLIPGYEKMVHALLLQGYEKGRDLEYYVAKEAEHNEPSWAARVWRPLKFFFDRRKHVIS